MESIWERSKTLANKIVLLTAVGRLWPSDDDEYNAMNVLVYRPNRSHDISHWVVTNNQYGNGHFGLHNDNIDDHFTVTVSSFVTKLKLM